MILENSGPNLALVEFAHALKLVVLYGLTAQCLLHAATFFVYLSELTAACLSVALILALALITAAVESVAVKLRWRATPEFIAYALTMSLFATGGALIGGMYARNGI
jgi:formate hydrogenlyase subunit 4